MPGPTDCAATISEAGRLLAAGLQGAASDLLEECMADGAEDPRVLRALARVRLLQGRAQDAADLLRRALNEIEMLKARGAGLARPDDRARQYPSHPSDDLDPEDLELVVTRGREVCTRRRYFDPEVDPIAGRVSAPTRAAPTAPPPVPAFKTLPRGVAPRPQTSAEARPSWTGDDQQPQSPALGGDARVRYDLPLDLLDGLEGEPEDEEIEDPPPEVQAVLDAARADDQAGIDGDDEDLSDDEARLLGIAGTSVRPSPTPVADTRIEGDDYSDRPTREEVEQHVRKSGRVERDVRALQIAIEVALKHGWDREGIQLLARVFERYWWSSARTSMERELARGMTPEELAIAFEVREFWLERPEYTIDFAAVWRTTLVPSGSPAGSWHRTLSWPDALAVVRAIGAGADLDEVEVFLDELYDHWYGSDGLRRQFESFHAYLQYRIGLRPGALRELPDWTFSDEGWEDTDPEEGGQTGCTTREYRWLERMGLIPNIWIERYGYLPEPADAGAD